MEAITGTAGRRAAHATSIPPLTVTVAETKRLSGLGATTIYQLLKEGKLEGLTIGKRRLITYASIQRLLAT